MTTAKELIERVCETYEVSLSIKQLDKVAGKGRRQGNLRNPQNEIDRRIVQYRFDSQGDADDFELRVEQISKDHGLSRSISSLSTT